jgi:hypothetical protein
MKAYSVETYDNIVGTALQARVWDYIQHQSYHATRKDLGYPLPGSIINYVPADGKKEYMDDSYPSVNDQYMHRCVFGNTELDLHLHHPVILELWNTINLGLGNKFTITGDKEGIADQKFKLARVYVNAQPDETIKRSHGIHRDTIDLDEGKNFTLLYIANLEWYPTWMAENIFYLDDDTTGDTQQFQKGVGQSRGFGIGDPFTIIPPKPGRVVLYDGRALHTTKPTAPWAKEMRYAVVFRIRLR